MKNIKTSICGLMLAGSFVISAPAMAYGGLVHDHFGNVVKAGAGGCLVYGKPEMASCPSDSGMAMDKKMSMKPMAKKDMTKNKDVPVVKQVINLKGVTFKTGSDELNASSFVRLNISAVNLNRNPELKVIIAGHTDNTGDTSNNLKLSQKRAEAVKAYLISRGVDASRLTARGYGDTEPAASNDTTEGRAQNRRVELRIQK